jgi:cobalt-zinc-cadmium efflux system outer membrane protein
MHQSRLQSNARRAAVALFGILLLGAVTAAGAAGPGEDHEHEPLPIDTALSLSEALEITMANYPTRRELEAREAEAQAWRERGGSLVAGRPRFSYRYQTDRWQDDAGLEELEAGIELPLWRWGERQATADLGSGLTTEAEAAGDALRWRLAGRLRDLLWQMELAGNETAVADERLRLAEERARVVRRRHELGDVPLADTLLADAARSEAEALLTEAEVMRVDSERTWRIVTTLERRPPTPVEAMSDRDAIAPGHPALRLAEAAVRRAEAEYSRSEKSARGSPSLFIGPRRERSSFRESFDDSIGIMVSVPFGGGSHARTATAAAARELAATRADRAQVERDLRMQLHEAEHTLHVIRRNLVSAGERARLTRRSHEMAQVAYEKGEIDLVDLLRLAESSITARRDLEHLRIAERQAIAHYNQAVGDLP